MRPLIVTFKKCKEKRISQFFFFAELFQTFFGQCKKYQEQRDNYRTINFSMIMLTNIFENLAFIVTGMG